MSQIYEHVSRALGQKCYVTQVSYLVFLKTRMHVDRAQCFFLISAMGFLAQFVRLLSCRTDFTIHKIFISIAHQANILFQPRPEQFSSFGTEGLPSVVD